jgi:phosphate transport system protein
MLLRSHQAANLINLQERLLRLAEGVDRALIGAQRAMIQQDIGAAQCLLVDNGHIDRLRDALERSAHRLLAQHPQLVGAQLRTASAALILAVELARIGEYAEEIAALAIRGATLPAHEPPALLGQIAYKAREMLQQAVRAVIIHNSTTVQRLRATEQAIDVLHQQLQQTLFTLMRDTPEHGERATYLLWSAHNLERVADRSVTIAERAAFIVTGVLPDREQPGSDDAWFIAPAIGAPAT